jgi:hypothetical protein
MGDADSRIQDDHEHNALMKSRLYRRALQDLEVVREREVKMEDKLTTELATVKAERDAQAEQINRLEKQLAGDMSRCRDREYAPCADNNVLHSLNEKDNSTGD